MQKLIKQKQCKVTKVSFYAFMERVVW